MKMWLPKPLYELLPTLYMFSGVLGLSRFPMTNALGLFSSTILVAMAIAIFILRTTGAKYDK
jgi:hypothetical protein